MRRLLYLFITIALVVSLISCSNADSSIVKSWNSSKPSGDLYISAEIVSKSTVDIDSDFEIRIGVGKFGNEYSTAEIRVTAPQLTISTADGTHQDAFYQIRYEDFDDTKYEIKKSDDTELQYFESIKFKYNGKEQNIQGCIGFKLVTIGFDGEEISGTAVAIYYEVKNGKIVLSTERPLNYSPNNNFTQ